MIVSLQPVEGFSLKKIRPLLTVVVLYAICQALFFQVSEVSQDSVRHIVSMKRGWAVEGNYLRRDPDKLLVFFMGGSRITGGVIPEVFDEKTGNTHSYNVSLPGMPLAAHYFWLKDYLARHDPFQYPDYIIVDPSGSEWNQKHFFDYALANAGFSEVLEYFVVTGNVSLLMNYFLPLRFHWPEVSRYLKSRFYSSSPGFFQDKFVSMYESKYQEYETYKHDWFYLFNSQFAAPEKHWFERKSLVEATRGYYDFREMSARGGPLPENYRFRKENIEPSPGKAARYLKKFLELTDKHGIKVILIDDYAPASQAEKPKILETMPSASPEDKADHVVVSPHALRKKLYENHNFSDPLHLTIPAAADFTRHIADVFSRTVKEISQVPL